MPDSQPSARGPQANWEAAALNTLRDGAHLSLYEKLQWLEEIEEVFLNLQRSRRVESAHAPGAWIVAEPPPSSAGDEPLP